jgi:hypothetical protein
MLSILWDLEIAFNRSDQKTKNRFADKFSLSRRPGFVKFSKSVIRLVSINYDKKQPFRLFFNLTGILLHAKILSLSAGNILPITFVTSLRRATGV